MEGRVCPHCGDKLILKRKVGVLSWLFAVLTYGLWGLVIYYKYPKVCIVCDMKPEDEEKTYKKKGVNWIYVSLVALVIGAYALSYYEDKNNKMWAEIQSRSDVDEVELINEHIEERLQDIVAFDKDPKPILLKIRNNISDGYYKEAVSITQKYLPSGNEILLGMHEEVKGALRLSELVSKLSLELANERDGPIVLAEAWSVYSVPYIRLRDIYEELVYLSPENDEYRAELNKYEIINKEVRREVSGIEIYTNNDRKISDYIFNDIGEECRFKQSVDEQATYIHSGPAFTGYITFDNPNCMSNSGSGLEVNKMLINNIVSKQFGKIDAHFQTSVSRMYRSSTLQIKGECIQSITYPAIGVAIDYVVENNSIKEVIYASAIQGCKN